MSFIRALKQPSLRCACSLYPIRCYAVKASKKGTAASPSSTLETSAVSSCPENTLLTGLNYLKGQPPVLALPDEEYPQWLWTLLRPKQDTDEGPGSLAEKRKMKTERRANIKYANLLKSQ